MHLVFATSIVPCGPPQSGYEIANAAILGALARLGVRVTIVGFAWPGAAPLYPEETVVLGHVDVMTDNAGNLQKLRWLAEACARGMTFSSVKTRAVTPARLRARLEALEPVDGIVLNSVQFAGAFLDVFARWPFAYVAHNVEHRSAEENAAAASSLVERLLYRREASLLAALERRLCADARFVYTFAEEDRTLLGLSDNARSAFLPLVTDDTAPAMAARQPEYDAALIGTWTWAPNRIGLDWFLGAVVPLLPESFTVAVAGQVPADLAASCPRVRFLGRVPDATDFVRKGRVVPLISRAGTGVQLKTIQTFELGLPSVATGRSLRGIAHLPENCIVADDAPAFAAALQRQAWGRPRDLDGRAFHRAQQEALDRELARGLGAFGTNAKTAAA